MEKWRKKKPKHKLHVLLCKLNNTCAAELKFAILCTSFLQLVISDVHFRYEDATTEENMSFAFGITIDKLSAQSTNETWVGEGFVVVL